MAITQLSTQSDLHFSEVLGRGALAAAQPRPIAMQFANMYSIAGRQSDNLKLNRYTDIGPAGTATEGTPYTTATTMGVETPVTLTPTEAAVLMAELTDDVIEVVGGFASARRIIEDGSQDDKLALLLPTAGRLARSAIEKAETDLVAEFGNLTTSVGSSTNNIDLGIFEEAIYNLDIAECPSQEYIACLHPRQVSDLRRAMAVTSGGLQGSVHVGSSVDHLASPNGFKFNLLGIPVFQYDKSAELTANTGADVVGAMYLRGIGNPEDPAGGQGEVGAFAMCEARSMQFGYESDLEGRSVKIMVNWKYDTAVRDADFGVKIVTDA
jgi:hypothetical protein